MERLSLCFECGKVYKPTEWFNPIDVCKVCQKNLMEYYARQMRLLNFNKPKLIYPKRDDNVR